MHDVEACTPTGYVLNGRAPTPGKFLHTQKVCSYNIWQWDIYDLNGNVLYCFRNVLKKHLSSGK